jgi:hypothetical protein
VAAYTRIRTNSDLFPVHVVDQDGFPPVEFTAYASRSPQHHAPRTAQAYTGAIVACKSALGLDADQRRNILHIQISPGSGIRAD